MTCIVAVRNNEGEVIFAGDTLASDGKMKTKVSGKVFSVGDFHFGWSGHPRLNQIIKYAWTPPPKLAGQSDEEFIHLEVVNSLKETLMHYDNGDKKRPDELGDTIIIVYKGRIYEMEFSFAIFEYDNFASVGSGSTFARGFYAGNGYKYDDKLLPSMYGSLELEDPTVNAEWEYI